MIFQKRISIISALLIVATSIYSCAEVEAAEEQQQFDILMITKTATLTGAFDPADLITRDSLEAWGYTVNMIDQEDYISEDHDDYRLVYFSESMNSEYSVHYRSTGFPISAFSHEPYIVDRLGLGRVNQEARDQQTVVEEMKIIASNHILTDGVWRSGQLVKVTENSSDGALDVFQFEFDLDDPEINSRVTYNVLGRTNLNNLPWKGYPTWAEIYGGKGQIPSGISIIIHAFHLGASEKGTSIYWQQVRRSVQYLMGDL